MERSYLYVPGHRSELLEKALASATDAVVIDLEDAVPPEHKERARGSAVAAAADERVWIRLNPLGTPEGDADVAALAAADAPTLRVRFAKAESAAAVRAACSRLAERARPVDALCLVESALGLERAYELARAWPRLRLSLGETDLSADLRSGAPSLRAYARARIVVASRAADLEPPVQSVYTNIRDAEGLRADTEAGRREGFFGRSVVHPAQIDVVNQIYGAAPAEVAAADELCTEAKTARAAGWAAFVLSDGRFVDPAVVRAAREQV